MRMFKHESVIKFRWKKNFLVYKYEEFIELKFLYIFYDVINIFYEKFKQKIALVEWILFLNIVFMLMQLKNALFCLYLLQLEQNVHK